MYDRRLMFLKAAWRVGWWRWISARRKSGAHRLPGLGFKMWLEPKFRSVGSLALFAIGSRYEPGLELLPKLLRSGDRVLDCGANQGAYALSAASLVGPRGRVVAVEPQEYAVRMLHHSITENGMNNLSVLQAAVSAANGTMKFYVGDVPVAASLSAHPEATGTDVPVWAIDTLAAEGRPGALRLIKLDVEGAEGAALRGASRTLAEDRPFVMYECWDASSDTSQEAWRLLQTHGYVFFDMLGGEVIERIHEPVRSTGILAAPAELLHELDGVQQRRIAA